MKKTYILGMMALAVAALTSCEPDKDPVLSVPADLAFDTPAYATELIELSPLSTLELTCEKAMYNVDLSPEYLLEVSPYADFGNSEDANVDEEGNIIPNSMVVEPVDPFNNKMILSGETLDLAMLKMLNVTNQQAFDALAPMPVYLRVIAEVGGNEATRIVSNAVKLDQVKLYYTSEALPYVCTPGGGNGWNFDASTKLMAWEKDAATGEWIKFRGLAYLDNEFKFTLGAGWNNNWGKGDAEGTLAPGADNIPVPAAGYYFIEINLSSLTYTMVPAEVCLIGELNGWDTNSAPAMSGQDGNNGVLTYTGTFEGGFKFIVNPKTTGWAINYGGELDNITFDGGNLSAGAGEHTVTFDLTTSPYTATIQ